MSMALQILILLAFPPLMLGIINKTKAAFAGRCGAPLLQPYRDIFKLLRKGLVLSRTTTWIFVLSPLLGASAIFLAGLLLPVGQTMAPVHFNGDMILFVYLFGLARFLTTAAALDTGSPFEGMGAAREVTFACLAEPAILFAFLALAGAAQSLSLSGMLQGASIVDLGMDSAPLVLVFAGLFVALLAENCRIPFDDPNTHLELTMIHEAMILDHSGPLLGVILYSAAMKLYALGAILSLILVPDLGDGALPWIAHIGAMALLSVLIGVVESVMARLQMRHIPHLLTSAALLCAFGFLLIARQ